MRVFALLLLASTAAVAQFDTGAVLGAVRDPSGLGVATAKVTLTNTATGVAVQATTNQTGEFEIFNVKAGRYTIAAEVSGFKKATSEVFDVSVNARQRVDLRLEVGTIAESVTVTGAAAALETESSTRGTTIGNQQIVNLPLNGRAYADLALLAPGVRRSAISSSRDASFNVNGMRSSQNNFLVDGVDNNAYGTSNQGFSNQVVQLSPDAVQEFKLETNNFSAEFGRAGGAVINASIRSGGNQYHGAAWEYVRNTKLNATGFFKPIQNRKPVLIQNQFGGAFGGPIKKEKMFFFLDYEGYRRISRSVAFATLPSVDQRRGILGITVRNPLTGEVYNGTVPERVITRSAREILADLPAPNRPGTANNFQSEPRRDDRTEKGDVRYDWFVNSKWNFFSRYSHRLMENFEPPTIPGASGGDANGDVRVRNIQGAMGVTNTVSPTMLMEFRLGVGDTQGGKFPIFRGTPTVGERFGIPNIPNDKRFTGGVVSIGINGFTGLGVQQSNPQFQDPVVWNPKFNVSKFAGRHSIKTGYEFQSIKTAIDDFNPKYGRSTYGGRFSQLEGTPNSDLQFLADFLMGARSGYALNNAVIVDYRQHMHFLYFQDDWKVSPKLVLNLGLRYEFATPQWEGQNRISNFDESAVRLVTATGGGLFERSLVRPDRNNFAPRFGLAYTATPKTVVRSAYGISYIHFNRMGGENILAYNLPHILNPSISQVAPALPRGGQPLCTSNSQNPLSCFRTFEMGNPDNFLSLANIDLLAVRTNHIPFGLRTAYTQSWHFTIQRELPRGWVADVAYVGNRSVKLMILGDLNQSRPNNPGENLNIQLRRPITNFGYIQSAFAGGFLNYHAFQTKIERRFAGGFYFLNSFTWSKSIDNASGHLETQNGDNSRVNYRDLRNERGLSGYDVPFLNATTLLWDLPFGKGRRFASSSPTALDYAIGGWRLTAINFAQSGTPVNLNYGPSAQFQVSGAPTYRPNITGNPNLDASQRTPQRWLNSDVVQLPTDPRFPFGNAGRNIVRGPSLHQMNLGLHKDFPIREGHTLEFRMESFNLFNKTNFASPNGNRSSGAFGTITGLAAPAREIQFALRYAF